MTTAFTASELIEHEPQEVWDVMTDWSRCGDWLPGVTDPHLDGATVVGADLTYTARGKPRTSRIVALEPGASITLRSEQGGVTADYVYRLVPADGGTRVGLEADVRTSGVWHLLAPVIRAAIRRADGGQLAALAGAVRGRLDPDPHARPGSR